MNPTSLKRFRRITLGLSVSDFARLTGTRNPRTVRKWEDGDNDIPGAVEALCGVLMELEPETRAFIVQRRLTA